MLKKYTILFAVLLSVQCISQIEHDHTASRDVLKGDDTLNGFFLPDFVVEADNNAYLKKYNKTKYFVRRMYAYSQIASDMLLAFNDTLQTIDSKRKKRVYLNKANRMLKEEFGDEIRKMSITRGEYLMKLLYRETGMTTYEIIQMYRGSSKAFWFQSLCKLNGQDLKRTYDPLGDDMMIERVVQEIEAGKYAYIKRSPKTETAKKARKKRRNRKKKNKK